MDIVPAMPRPEGTQGRIGVLMRKPKNFAVQFNEKEFNNAAEPSEGLR